MPCYWYKKSHYRDKTVDRPSYLHNWIFYTGKSSICLISNAFFSDQLLCYFIGWLYDDYNQYWNNKETCISEKNLAINVETVILYSCQSLLALNLAPRLTTCPKHGPIPAWPAATGYSHTQICATLTPEVRRCFKYQPLRNTVESSWSSIIVPRQRSWCAVHDMGMALFVRPRVLPSFWRWFVSNIRAD